MSESRETQILLRPLRTAHEQLCRDLERLKINGSSYVQMPVLYQNVVEEGRDTSDGETFFTRTRLSDEAAGQLEAELKNSLDARLNKSHLFHSFELKKYYSDEIVDWYVDAKNIFGFVWYAASHNLEPARQLFYKIVQVTGIPGLAMIMLWLQYQDTKSMSRLKYEAAVATTFFRWLKPGVEVTDQFAMAYYHNKWQVQMPKTLTFATDYFDRKTYEEKPAYAQECRRVFAEKSNAKRVCRRRAAA